MAPARCPSKLPRAAPACPPRAFPLLQPRAPYPHVAPQLARARSAKYRTRVPGKCAESSLAAVVWRRARSRRTGEWLRHPCRGGGGSREGTRRGLPGELRLPGGAPTPAQGRVAGAGAGRPRARRAYSRAPLVPARNAAAPWRSGRRRARGGGGDAQWNSPRRHRPTRAARRPRTLLGAAMKRPGPPEGLQSLLRSDPVRARRPASSNASAQKGGVRAGVGGGDWREIRSGERECLIAAARRDAASWSQHGARQARGGDGRRPARTGRAPPPGGAAPSRAVHGAVRGSRCPGAGGGPAP